MPPTTPMPAAHSPATLYILLGAVRCWAAARRRRRPAMAQLHLRLRRYGCEQLSPALDSLLRLGEQVTGHGLRTGRGTRLTEDENLLIDLLQARWTGPVPYTCSDAIACAFCYAVRSTQILLAQALEDRRSGTAMSIRNADPHHC
ncbi:hypothetical protein PMI04_004200 [Sphingobium sp. AP49]|uniref:hypothetical protein n=1 Tax=Sphingobium sp. AP49 TaxID=1144307 RepID=UPI00026ED905|nr:hypothetical protein [Sphingobium sp. AP49]WHO39799.1 hypothetical protein PMI04_004200 [Sphingobium sp. AP49]